MLGVRGTFLRQRNVHVENRGERSADGEEEEEEDEELDEVQDESSMRRAG